MDDMPSSVVARMEYMPAKHTLRITYTRDLIYDYCAVPEDVYNKMKAAPSKGQFLNYNIKGNYRYKRVKDIL